MKRYVAFREKGGRRRKHRDMFSARALVATDDKA